MLTGTIISQLFKSIIVVVDYLFWIAIFISIYGIILGMISLALIIIGQY